jgi:hypothetical protein
MLVALAPEPFGAVSRKEPLVAGLFIGALLLANGVASSYPAPVPGRDGPRLPQWSLDRWQEEHLDHYTKLRPVLFTEHAALPALCAR